MSTTNILDLNNRIDALEKFAHNVEPIQQQIDELKAWTDSGTKDASGNPIILTDGAELEPTALTVTLEESEDGYTECVVDRDGKNLLPMTVAQFKADNTNGTWSGNAYTLNGVTFTVQTDADENVTGIKVNGTASADTILIMLFTGVNATQYTLTGCPSSGSTGTYFLDTFGTNISRVVDIGSGVSFTANGTKQYVRIGIMSGYAIPTAGLTFYPMICLASVSDATFEPYSHDTATITFGETVNAGNVDFITGIVTVTSPEAKTLTLTPDNITLLKEYNYISSAGNIDISYHPDNLYSAELVMDNRIAALEEKMSLLAGGDTGQVLTKTSDDDYDVAWETLPATRTTTKKSEK